LQPEEAYAVIDAINKDSDLLASLGIMDYSLIVGVTNVQYEVDLHGDNLPSSRQSFSRQSFSRQSFSRPVVRRQDSPTEQSYEPSPATSVQTPDGSVGMADQQQQQQLTIDTASETASVADDGEHGASFFVTSPSARPKSLRNQLSNLSSGQGGHGYAVRAVVGPGIYYLGIIDILQPWTVKKRLERFAKTTLLGKNASGLSCMPPEPYRDRFQRKISQLIEHTIFIREVTGSWKGPRFKSGPEYIDGI
jgi:1-phosphatidylinositol-4-phosphate 5-kinase